jgi:hypothetical protein
MKIKRWLGAMILATWLNGSGVFAQSLTPPIFPPPAPLDKDGAPPRPSESVTPPGGGLSDWITYHRDCCDGPRGKVTPLYAEAYLSSGPTTPVGTTTLSHELRTGWSFMGGVRGLFFNEAMTNAWVIDLHIINTNEGSRPQPTQFPITFFQNGTRSDLIPFKGSTRTTFSVENINRASLGAGIGRDWYLCGAANADGCKWRVGATVGGRYGSERANFNEFGHTVDVVGSAYMSGHSELEFLCGHILCHVGVRLEWSYTWSDVLQRNSDSQDFTLFVTTGIRW